MEPKTKPESLLEMVAVLTHLSKMYGELIQDIGGVVKEHAMVHLDTVDSKILVNILERHARVLIQTLKTIKDI